MLDFLIVLKRNFVSPIVITIYSLSIILLFLGDVRDAFFISFVITINTLFAIIQELRAQHALKKLELLNRPMARLVASDGSNTEVTFDSLKVGDTVALQSGDEIPADVRLTSSSGLEVDESMLTGESAAIEKPKGSTVYAASVVMAGSAVAGVTAIGEATKVGIMSTTLKRYVTRPTPLQRAIGRAITWLTWGALFLATLIFVAYRISGQDAVIIFKTITAAAVTVVPEGLLLASTLLLAFGALRLAQANVLPQKLGAIEAMALLDVLCVDKTGTLTSDTIHFESFELFDKTQKNAASLVGIAARETSSNNSTGEAIMAALPIGGAYSVNEVMAFSSQRKMSGVRVVIKGKSYSVVMGAPEYMSKLATLTAKQQEGIDDMTKAGKRVLMVAMFDPKTGLKKLADGSGTALGLVVLSNQLREGVSKTVAYLQKNGVSVRVISGDNPNTVRYVAAQVGIRRADKVITGAELAQVSDIDWDKVVAKTTIFARVLPEQKERLVETFQRLGNFTGMVGDGVNDALAIKKADLGVAMYDGASATRRVADVVLMDNSFNSLPMGMRLGNRIMQAIEIIATLFFHKMIYGVVLLLATITLGMVYPFEPRHVTFMNIFLVTMPTIMWTLFAPRPRHRLSPKFFWKDTLQAVAPIAFITGITVTIVYAVLSALHPNNPQGVSTTTVLVATLFGIYLVFLVPHMFDVKNTRIARIARALYIAAVVVVVTLSFGLGFARDFFDFTTPAWQNTWQLLVVIIIAALLQGYIAYRAGLRLKKREP